MKAVILRFDENGNWSVHNSAGVRVFCVDENSPDDRVYEMTNTDTEQAAAAIIGDSPIGHISDERQPGIEARIREAVTGEPRLKIVETRILK